MSEIRGVPPIPIPQHTDDPHADFHQRSMLEMPSPLCTTCRTHAAPDSPSSVCWLLDVRKYGIAVAREMHPLTDDLPVNREAS